MLDIYLTQDSIQTARGQLYLDDGETFRHATHKEYTLVEFSYQDGDLFIRTPHSNYKAGQSFVIDEINLFGMRKHPKRVIIRTGDMAAPGKEILYKYNFDEEHLEITELKIHMINHASD